MTVTSGKTVLTGDVAMESTPSGVRFVPKYRWWKQLLAWTCCGLYRPWYVIHGNIHSHDGCLYVGDSNARVCLTGSSIGTVSGKNITVIGYDYRSEL